MGNSGSKDKQKKDSKKGKPNTQNTKYILLLGTTGAGKTTLINHITGSKLEVSDGQSSCTSGVQFSRGIKCEGHTVVLIDTPGFDHTSRDNDEILRDMKILQHKQNLLGVIYLHDISQTRMGHTALHNTRTFSEAVGQAAARNVTIITTRWDTLQRDENLKLREDNLAKYFQPLIKAGAVMKRYNAGDDPKTFVEELVGRCR